MNIATKVFLIGNDFGAKEVMDFIRSENSVISFGDAMMGLEAAMIEAPDVVLIDIDIKGGLVALETLKREKATRLIPLLVFSGSDDNTLKEKVFRLGIVDFISKLCSVEETITRIKNYFYNLLLKKEQRYEEVLHTVSLALTQEPTDYTLKY